MTWTPETQQRVKRNLETVRTLNNGFLSVTEGDLYDALAEIERLQRHLVECFLFLDRLDDETVEHIGVTDVDELYAKLQPHWEARHEKEQEANS